MSYGVAMMVNQNDKLSFLSGCFIIKLYKSQRKSNKIRIGLFHSVARFSICLAPIWPYLVKDESNLAI